MAFKLGLYNINLAKPLGSGTFGTVYKATKGKEQFAVKSFKKDESYDQKKIEEEVRAMTKLNGHEFIMAVIECMSYDNGIWLVMEFGDLGDLQGYLDKNKMTLPDKTRMMYQIASGLSHIHSNNIVHRDLKPQNIILKQQHSSPVAKITDFGEAKMLADKPHGRMMDEMMKTVVGTQFYWAPELCKAYDLACKRGSYIGRYRASVDIFAIGLIFQVILQNGGYPLSEKCDEEYKAKRVHMVVPLGREMLQGKKPVVVRPEKKDNKEVKEVKTVILRMTEMDAERRMDLSEVINRLQNVYPEPDPKPTSGAGGGEESETPHILVAAIDFGTTFSGYAFSFTSSQDNIYMYKDWDAKPGFMSYKAPTSVLTDKKGNFVDFGYAAEKRYAEDDSDKYELFRHFKMMLHKKGISQHTTITSEAGKPQRALDIFAMALAYLKDNIVKNIKSKLDHKKHRLQAGDLIKWVITVPAIWTDEAKTFMRTAAFQAGMIKFKDSRKLLIALEPEAASFWCRGMNTRFDVGKGVQFQPGESYMVIDAGGGTVDITTHEVLSEGNIKEIDAANGDAMGGTKVDENIVKLLKEILGEDFIKRYEFENQPGWFRLRNELEVKKKSAKPSGGSRFTIPVDAILGQKYHEHTGRSIDEIGNADGGKAGYRFNNGVLEVQPVKVQALFDPVVQKIVDHIAVQLCKPKLAKCKYLIVVGGFGECAFLQKAIQDKFGGKYEIMIPSEAETTVIRGAVIFGHNPSIVRGRIAMNTYGTYSTPPFDSSKHDPKYRIEEDGQELCNKVFNSFIEKGESVETGKTITRYFSPNSATQSKMYFNLFVLDRPTDDDKIEYVESPMFQKVGDCVVNLPKRRARGQESIIALDVTFGGTEIVVQAKDIATDTEVAMTTINFKAK